MGAPLLQIKNLEKRFSKRGLLSSFGNAETVAAVDDISLYVNENETLGLVGESGCGKTTTGKMILKLATASAGQIIYDDIDITRMPEKDFRPYRSSIQMIFQDLDAALNPKMKIRDILKEAIKIHQKELNEEQVEARAKRLLELVNLKQSKMNSRPSELSGGEKRRVGIARVLAVEPKFIVADEPTSALDVSIQAQVVNLMQDLQKELGLSYLFISHDLPLVEILSHRIAVMYLGRIVETGKAEQIAKSPKHPYTAMLWSSMNHQPQSADKKAAELMNLDVERPKTGCRFAPRCPVFHSNGRPSVCTDPDNEPKLPVSQNDDHVVACHFPLNR
ncbi:MAG: ABC transporter ATP-binding protein [Gammaproteobacteria bacterium]|nr:ABC transporter ATP-binding protein [Gammaproteobacteria bacterium]